QSLYAYWNDVRDGRPAPRRFDIEPSRISHILSETLILERVDFETYKFRLAGTRICQQFGRELRGEDFFTLWDLDEDRTTLEHHLSCITRQFRIGVFTFEAAVADAGTRGREQSEPVDDRLRTVTCEMILLPLVHTQGRVDRCLGAISRAYSPGVEAQGPLTDHRLTQTNLIVPDRPPVRASLSSVATSGTAAKREDEDDGNQRPFGSNVRSARIVRSERRQFRVYDGGLADEPAVRIQLRDGHDG
ncbi:MAG: PAS domain-containing protein, partial [Pseudomonadota bacterium]